MTPDDSPPPASSGAFGAGDEIDFAALVAEQNASRSSRKGRSRAGSDSKGPAPAAVPAAVGASASTLDDPEPPSPFRTLEDLEPPAPRPEPELDADDTGSGGSTSRWWRIGYPSAVVIAVLLLPLLVWSGLRVILDSSDGQLVKRVTDPAAPGYEAAVDKTPTALVALTDAQGRLDSMALVALTSQGAAGIVLMPAGLLNATAYGEFPASTWFEKGGIQSLSQAVGTTLKLGFSDAIVVPSTEWKTLAGPYGGLTVVSPDPVRDASDKQLFPKGSNTITAEQVWTFLGSRSPNESDLNRLVRQGAFWKAYMAKVGSTAVAFPLPTESGIGFFLSSAAKGQVSVSDLPVVAVPSAPGTAQTFKIQEQAAQDTIAAVVPFPDGGGMRARFRVLDGTGQLDHGLAAAIVMAAAGAQVDIIGNADSFDVQTTEFIYYDGTSQDVAKHFQQALGIGDLVESKASNSSADLVLILGADYVAKGGTAGIGSSSTTVAAR